MKTAKQIKEVVLHYMEENKAELARIDEEWNGVYGDLSCSEYAAYHAYHGALLDILTYIDSEDE